MKKLLAITLAAAAITGAVNIPAMAQSNVNKAQAPKEITAENVTKEQIEAFQMMYVMMKPEQKEAIAEEVRKGAAKIKPDQKEAIIKRAQTHYRELDAEQKAFLRSQLLEIGSKLTPEERAAYLKRLEE